MSIQINPFTGQFDIVGTTGGGGGGGTVTSVGLSLPSIFNVTTAVVTSSGTLTAVFNTEPANTVFSGPTSGSNAIPIFRSLVIADIPALPYTSNSLTSSHILVGNSSNVATDVALTGDASITNTGDLTVNSVGGATSTEIGYLTGATSNIQTQLNNKMSNPSILVTQTVYVAVGGNDTTGDGSIGNPFLTVSKALSIITTAQSDNRFMIKLMGGKIVDTTTPLLKPWVYIVGDNEDGTYWKVTAPGTSIGIDPSFATVGGARFGISNVYIGAGTTLNIDLNSVGPGIGTPSAELDLEDITITGDLNFLGRAPDIDYMQLKGLFLFGTFNADAAQNIAIGCTFNGTSNLTSNVAENNSEYSACVFQGPVNISGSNINLQQITASPMFSTLLVDGASTTLNADITSLPLESNQTISGGATLNKITDAYNLAYAPAVSGNWSPAPTYVSEALDQLASRLNGIDSEIVDSFTLNSSDISNGYVVLSSTPITANNTILLLASAPNQFYGTDYTVIGNHMSWAGLGLDGILSSGDNLMVLYN